MKIPTLEQLKAWSPEDRLRVRQRAAQRGDALGDEVVALIDGSGLPLTSGGGLSTDHPLYLEMRDVVWSTGGKAAALDAVAEGLPAMAKVDPLLQAQMGSRYSADQQMTRNAGYIVAEFLRSRGFEPEGEAPLPEGCVAKSAALFRQKRPLK